MTSPREPAKDLYATPSLILIEHGQVHRLDSPLPMSAASTERASKGSSVHMYLVRYGIMGHVGRFSCLPESTTRYERGEIVVIHSHRGLELGEVLFVAPEQSGGDSLASHGRSAGHAADHEADASVSRDLPHVLRVAGSFDLEQSRQALESRATRYSECKRVLDEGDWQWELVDVEPLLDGRSTVIHYLGPHRIDATSWRARFRVECDFDVVLEPVGADVDDRDSTGCGDSEGGCGNCDCGAGACGTSGGGASIDHERAVEEPLGCGPSSHKGCTSCGISQVLAARRGHEDNKRG